MKTIKMTAFAAMLAVGALFTSCGSGVSSTVSMKSAVDSVSYAYGANFYQQGLERQLQQMGIIGDTLMLSATYTSKIAKEEDELAKGKLQKEYKQKLDSIKSGNQRKLSAFFKGFQEGISAKDAEEAHIVGLAFGNQVGTQAIPAWTQQTFGPEAKAEEKFSKNMFLSGMLTTIKGEKPAIEDAEMYLNMAGQAAQLAAAAEQEKKLLVEFAANKEVGEKFLAENKDKADIITLESGVQYKIIKAGKGAMPALTDKVKCHYHGTLIDGTVFDSSVDRGQPASFGVNQVIPGWTELLQLMPVGSKWQVYIPQDKGYGAREAGVIQPFSALVFDIELLDIEK